MKISVLGLPRLSEWIVLAVATAILALALLYTQFAFPAQDDFCFATNSLAPHEFANVLYQSWSGRWLTMFLYAAVASGDDLSGQLTQVMSVASIATWATGFVIISDILLDGRPMRKLAYGLVFFAVFWGSARGIGDTVYWTAGYFTYPLPFLFSALAMNLGLRQSQATLGLSAACGFLAASLNELSGIVLIAGLVTAAFWRFAKERTVDRRLALIALAALVGVALVVFSPGNGARTALQASSMSWPKFAYNLVRPYESLASIFFVPAGIGLSIATALLPGRGAASASAAKIALSGLVAVAAGYVAFMVASSATPTARVLDYLWAVALVCLVWASSRAARAAVQPTVRIGANLVLAGLLFTAPNVSRGLHDLKVVSEWSADHARIHQELKTSAGQDVVVPEYARYPGFFAAREISRDPNDDGNKCLARRFGLRSIRSEGADGLRWTP